MPYFSSNLQPNSTFSPPLKVEDYAKSISKLANDTDEALQKFAFKVFDVDRVDKITEKGLFTFMQYTSSIKQREGDKKQTEILKLGEMENDIFIDHFSNQYIKLLKALARKK